MFFLMDDAKFKRTEVDFEIQKKFVFNDMYKMRGPSEWTFHSIFSLSNYL
jgi:predicted acetyltransferase